MDRTEHFYKIEILIRNRGGVSFQTLLSEFEVSPATPKRDLQLLRERMDAPIVYDRGDDAYRFAPGTADRSANHALPWVWFGEPALRDHRQCVAEAPAAAVALAHAWQGNTFEARRLAAASRALPRHLVSARLVP